MSFFTDAEAAWNTAGGDPALAPRMAAIASAESVSGTQLLGDRVNGAPTSFGAWQIHTTDGRGNAVNTLPGGAAYDTGQLTNSLDYNAAAAVSVYNSQGLTAWTAFRNGNYLAFLNGGTAGGVPNSGASSGTSAAPMTGLFSTSGGTFAPVALTSGASTLALLAAGAVVLLAVIAMARGKKSGGSAPAAAAT